MNAELAKEQQACILDHFPDGSDLFYWYKYAMFETNLWVDADLHHDFSVQLLPVGVLTLEDGTEHVFLLADPGEFNTISGLDTNNIGGLTFTPEVSNDSNGDGIIDASLEIRLNPIFTK